MTTIPKTTRAAQIAATIARLFGKLSADNVSRRVKYGILAMTSEESLLLATLPKIETTLEIARVA